jgi:hypothetical protein
MSGPAGGVHVDHPRAGERGRFHGLRHGVGDVVELEVEEHAHARLGDALHERRAFEREQPAADLHAAHRVAELLDELQRAGAVFDVERD